jgi:wyosine [tRNA(Phe)-imidazoG37] synthetase (radical SAM superfamily)
MEGEMEEGTFRYVFGPVLSGRLGRSLGLDLLGARICSMNCVYCESGPLERMTLSRAPYVPAAALLAELRAWEAGRVKRGEPLPDVVTLGGMGEPTLNSEMPQIIEGVRSTLPGVPVAVLTNASLMTDPSVRAELARADMVLPSLDSLVPEEFARVNRGHPGLDPASIAGGVLAFRRESAAKLYLEVLLSAGVNDSARNLELLTEYCGQLKPDRVDVVTLSRPGTEAWARPVDAATLARWREALGACAVSCIGEGPGLAGSAEKGQEQPGDMSLAEARSRIQASLARRPQTAAQLSSALLAEPSLVERALSELLSQGLAEEVRRDAVEKGVNAADVYYQARG